MAMTLQTKNVVLEVAVEGAAPGLENVIAAQTVLSHVDGAAGRLVVRGHDLDSLASWRFEKALALLWRDLALEQMGEEEIRAVVGRARGRAFKLLRPLLSWTDHLSQVEALRLLLSTFADEENGPHHVLAVAAVPVFSAAIPRRRKGQSPVAPDATLSLSADFLRMVNGATAAPEKVSALDTYLVTVADHGLNASTFTARIIASTKAGLFSSVIGALCALKGPLHGGALAPVLDMLDAIGEERRIHTWLVDALSRDERLMGFGHRIYRVRDPRADVLKGAVQSCATTGDEFTLRRRSRKRR
jgi:citrate synthase